MKKNSGLDIDLGNECSRIAFQWAKKTAKNRSGSLGESDQMTDGSFSGALKFGNYRLGISSDGIGTKIELAERMQKYDTLGFDLVAMVVDDLAANGYLPTNLSNILDVDFLDAGIVNNLMQGLARAADFAGISVTGGEIAELGNRICGYGNSMHFNWCSTAIGYLPEELTEPVDGRDIIPGDHVVVIKSRGFRSNGFSLVRKIMSEKFGPEWHRESYNQEQSWGEILLTPSLIYSPLINNVMKSGIELKGICHVTGGGIPDNLTRILKDKGLGAEIDHPFEPLPAMNELQKIGKITDRQAYRIWNMGNGMILICDDENIDELMKIIVQNKYRPRVAGRIDDKGNVRISSAGIDREKLVY